jgi:hypothetical protein
MGYQGRLWIVLQTTEKGGHKISDFIPDPTVMYQRVSIRSRLTGQCRGIIKSPVDAFG